MYKQSVQLNNFFLSHFSGKSFFLSNFYLEISVQLNKPVIVLRHESFIGVIYDTTFYR